VINKGAPGTSRPRKAQNRNSENARSSRIREQNDTVEMVLECAWGCAQSGLPAKTPAIAARRSAQELQKKGRRLTFYAGAKAE
jgi:hypothetical protein